MMTKGEAGSTYRRERRRDVFLRGEHKHGEAECRGNERLDEHALCGVDARREDRANTLSVSTLQPTILELTLTRQAPV